MEVKPSVEPVMFTCCAVVPNEMSAMRTSLLSPLSSVLAMVLTAVCALDRRLRPFMS